MPLLAWCSENALLKCWKILFYDPMFRKISPFGWKEGRMINRATSQMKTQLKRTVVNIHIGDYYASKESEIIHTVLGSCVAVCLIDPYQKIGGMNHILLPGNPDLENFDDSARYGINAMELLINKIMRLGGKKRLLIAKAFGGGHIMPSISKKNGVGRQNAKFVIDFLNNEKIKIVNQDLGGQESRKIYFHTDTGEVFVKRIRHNCWQNIAREEKKQSLRIRSQLKNLGDVVLF